MVVNVWIARADHFRGGQDLHNGILTASALGTGAFRLCRSGFARVGDPRFLNFATHYAPASAFSESE